MEACMPSTSENLVAENTFTDWIKPKNKNSKRNAGFLNLSVSGTWVGTVTVQYRYDGGGTIDLPDGAFTANTSRIIEDYENEVEYRAGFKTGDYSSGTAAVRLGA
jgi:hypothetical protein